MAHAQPSSHVHSCCQKFNKLDGDINAKELVLKAPDGHYWQIYPLQIMMNLGQHLSCFS